MTPVTPVAGSGVLVVLRGNSGSGKSTVARAVQERFPRGACAVVSQDDVRRKVLREPDTAGSFTVDLIGSIARQCLEGVLVVVVEGILHAGRYQRMLEEVAGAAEAAHFFAWDLSWEETVRRHDLRPQRSEFTVEQMRRWFHGWQPLDFTVEARLDESVTAEHAVERVLAAIGR